MKRKLAVDIDNTIWDLVSPWIDCYNHIYKDNIQYEDIVRYDFFSITNKATKEEMFEILCKEEFWGNVYPYKYSKEYLKKLNNEFELYIITSTSYKTPKVKFDRFFELFDFITEDQLIITSNKHLLNVDILIDDCIKNLTEGSYMKFLIDSPYNRECVDNSIIRVKDLHEVYNYLHRMN